MFEIMRIGCDFTFDPNAVANGKYCPAGFRPASAQPSTAAALALGGASRTARVPHLIGNNCNIRNGVSPNSI
jgi:hypothetical protein